MTSKPLYQRAIWRTEYRIRKFYLLLKSESRRQTWCAGQRQSKGVTQKLHSREISHSSSIIIVIGHSSTLDRDSDMMILTIGINLCQDNMKSLSSLQFVFLDCSLKRAAGVYSLKFLFISWVAQYNILTSCDVFPILKFRNDCWSPSGLNYPGCIRVFDPQANSQSLVALKK